MRTKLRSTDRPEGKGRQGNGIPLTAGVGFCRKGILPPAARGAAATGIAADLSRAWAQQHQEWWCCGSGTAGGVFACLVWFWCIQLLRIEKGFVRVTLKINAKLAYLFF